MRFHNIILTLAILALCAGAGFGQAELRQQSGKVLTEEEAVIGVDLLLLRAEAGICARTSNEGDECKVVQNKLALIYNKIARSPALISFLAAQAMSEYDRGLPQAKSAPQISQIADQQNGELLRLIVAQNQRIIELLEQIAAKNRPEAPKRPAVKGRQ